MNLTAITRTSLSLTLCLAVAGCVTSTTEQFRQGTTGINFGTDSIVILSRKHNVGYETESDFTACVGGQLRAGERALRVHDEKVFVDSMFPWFEPRTAPLTTSQLPTLLANPKVNQRISDLGIRYLVWLDGSTQTEDSEGTMSCTISPAGGGCFGFVTWDNDSSYEASIWDMRQLKDVGRISSDATGTSYMPAVIIPIPLIARTQKAACKDLAQQLRSFLIADG